jgi:hypothetical protein
MLGSRRCSRCDRPRHSIRQGGLGRWSSARRTRSMSACSIAPPRRLTGRAVADRSSRIARLPVWLLLSMTGRLDKSLTVTVRPPRLQAALKVAEVAVDRRAADPQRAGDRGTVYCLGAYIWRASRILGWVITAGRPPARPRARAAASPAVVRSRIRSRSNSASAAKMWNTSLPPGGWCRSAPAESGTRRRGRPGW